jgi:hypothetical protein
MPVGGVSVFTRAYGGDPTPEITGEVTGEVTEKVTGKVTGEVEQLVLALGGRVACRFSRALRAKLPKEKGT